MPGYHDGQARSYGVRINLQGLGADQAGKPARQGDDREYCASVCSYRLVAPALAEQIVSEQGTRRPFNRLKPVTGPFSDIEQAVGAIGQIQHPEQCEFIAKVLIPASQRPVEPSLA